MLISGVVRAIDTHGRAWLASVQLDDKPFCPHMLLRVREPVARGDLVTVQCEFRHGQYLPVAEQ